MSFNHSSEPLSFHIFNVTDDIISIMLGVKLPADYICQGFLAA